MEFVNYHPDGCNLRNQNQTRRFTRLQKAVEMPSHGPTVVGHKHASEVSGQREHLRIIK